MTRQRRQVAVIDAHVAIPRKRPTRWRAARQSTPWPTPRSTAPRVPDPGPAEPVWRATFALPECGPGPAACPILPAPRSATVRWNRSAPTPLAPITGKCSQFHKNQRAIDKLPPCGAATPWPATTAPPATRRRAPRREPVRTPPPPNPTLPSPPPPAPASASPRSPSALRCRFGCARSSSLRLPPRPSERFFLSRRQTLRAHRLVPRVRQHPHFRRHFRHAPACFQQRLRFPPHFVFQHPPRSLPRLGLKEPFRAPFPVQLHRPLPGAQRHAERPHICRSASPSR